jgi:hypothetical protein
MKQTSAQEAEGLRERYLEGSQVRLSEGPSGVLRLTIEGERSYIRVKAYRAFPISNPDYYIGFCDDANKEIGVLKDPKQLDADSNRLLARALRRRYLAARILNVHTASERYGVSNWHVETDRGAREFFVTDHTESIRHLGNGRLSIQDVDGNRFDVPDYRDLDSESYDLLDKLT